MKANLTRGKTLFENLEEYPLPKKQGVKDFVFYCFRSPGDRYGGAARVFFNKYYKNHVAKNTESLEEIIDILHSDTGPADQIREIVIVCHANIRELIFPVTKHASDNEENMSKYRVVRAGTLVNLQEAFGSGDPALADFKAKRKVVIRKLAETSRVTIRACNFGTSRDGLFALYSFFGGRANVYAPHEYQFFLDELGIGLDKEKLRLGVGSRLKSDLEFYQHLIKQGFISRKTRHSDSRRVKAIKKLIEPGRGMNRFELAGYTIRNNRVVNGNKDEHDSFVQAFNRRTVHGELEERFLREQLTFSGEGTIRVIRPDEKWILMDERLSIKIGGRNHVYHINYKIRVEHENFLDDANHKAFLYVYPVLNHRKSLPSIPFQLFFSDFQNELFRGRIFELARYATVPDQELNSDAKESYEAYVKLLDEGDLGDDSGHSIPDAFKQEYFTTLTDPVVIQKTSENKRKQWEIHDKITVPVKEVVDDFSSGDQRIVLIAEYEERLVELSDYWIVDGQISDIKEKRDYDAYEKLLDDGRVRDGHGRNIFRDIMGGTATRNVMITQLSQEDGKKRWEFQCLVIYEVKETFSYIHPKGFLNSIKVIAPMTRAKVLEFFAMHGSDPDNPGTELMAYLDNLSLEELFDLIHFLRDPYKEEHAFYMHMAQQAMIRKSDLTAWPPYAEDLEKNRHDPIYEGPYWIILSDLERVHKDKYAHLFTNVWMESKVSSSRNKDFNDDLFEERKLPFPPEILEEIMEQDSPVNDPDIMERDINNPEGIPDPPPEFFGGKDMVFAETTIPQEDLSCQKFKEALEVLKENQGKSWEQIEQVLKETRIGDSSATLYDYLTENYGFNSIKLANDVLGFFSPYASSPGIIGSLGRLAVSRGIFLGSLGISLLSPVLTMKSIIDEIGKGEDNYEAEGIITGLKQGRDMIWTVIFRYNHRGTPIADSYDIVADAPELLIAHLRFLATSINLPFPSWLEARERGYEIGLNAVNKAVNENLRKYERVFKQYVMDKGLKECHSKELLNSGLIDENMVKRAILENLYNQISEIARYELIHAE